MGFVPAGATRVVQHKTLNVTNHSGRIKDKNHMITLVDPEKAFDEF